MKAMFRVWLALVALVAFVGLAPGGDVESATEDGEEVVGPVAETDVDAEVSAEEPTEQFSFPVALNQENPVVRFAMPVDIRRLRGAREVGVSLEVFDADNGGIGVDEGQLVINDVHRIALFREQGAVELDNAASQVAFSVPASVFVDGPNLFEFRWLGTGGYEVRGMSLRPLPLPTEAALLKRVQVLEDGFVELERRISGVGEAASER